MAQSKKKIKKIALVACKRFMVDEPQRSIILDVVAPEKVSAFLEVITTTKRDVFNALCFDKKTPKKEISENFIKAFNSRNMWDEYSEFDSLKDFQKKHTRKIEDEEEDEEEEEEEEEED